MINNRAQTEIIGLVIVMVLVVMGIMFTMLFIFGRDSVGLSEEFREADLPQSTLDALLKTTSFTCDGRTIDQALRDCIITPTTMCSGTTKVCTAVRYDSEKILSATLKEWGLQYRLDFGTDTVDAIDNNFGSCIGEYRMGSQRRNFIGSDIDILLKICS